ncbi:MAG TPA: radical SAM protein [Methylomirabilota bacterium]|nr:radical SAM protein [Methylomirabilota bacterium]
MAPRMGHVVDARREVEFREMQSAGLVNRVTGRSLPFGWTVNPYRGCEMGCHYCFARYTHGFLGFTDPREFERTVYVKRIERTKLVAELRRARRSGLAVAMGTATDPYQPAEAQQRVARLVLEAVREVPGLRLSITTKSALVTRDLDLLSALAEYSEVSVNISITTLDAALARRLEPRAPRPDLRLATLAAVARAGVSARMFVMPVLPFITDGDESLRTLLTAARAAGAAGAESNVLFLQPGTRETFFAFLEAERPELLTRYQGLYDGSAYARADYVAEIEARVRRIAAEVGIAQRCRADRPIARPAEQLGLIF